MVEGVGPTLNPSPVERDLKKLLGWHPFSTGEGAGG
ncbi:hypothetical protein AHMF7616_03959 [Adhaeribacter pallidiroseus]|uniref:Uncharacterized protein n=1 Tax=Adhaeribacter pallidiroseus TaxID=2072847 RepID=A0A369QR70_9BACT|nr:hypothetical protein AHMF7616_03959 [Adhaeribacter pallidiroseus]